MAEIVHLIELCIQLSGAGLVLPNNLCAMLLCTGLGDNYASLITTAVHTIGTTDFTPAKLISMILAELQQQSTSLANHITPASSSKGHTIKKANCQRWTFLLLLLSLMWGAGRKSLKGERERVRGEVAGFRNSKSRALSQQDFSFSLCAAPEFQV